MADNDDAHEIIVVFDRDGKAIHWHDPTDASATHVPDSDDLFDFIWENRKQFGGFAHIHPWADHAAPSPMDITTFYSWILGLSKKRTYLWPIVTLTDMCIVVWDHNAGKFFVTDADAYPAEFLENCQEWVDELRRRGSTPATAP